MPLSKQQKEYIHQQSEGRRILQKSGVKSVKTGGTAALAASRKGCDPLSRANINNETDHGRAK